LPKKKGKAKAKKKGTGLAVAPPQERVDAELVESDFEQNPNDEILAKGEGFDHEQSEEVADYARRAGAPGEPVIQSEPSSQMNPYVSEEEQGMEMRPAVVGPPAFGSPDAATSAGRLVPLSTHPLRAEALPEGHPSAISEDFGQGYDGTLHGVDTVTQRPGGPPESQQAGENFDATKGAIELAEEKGVDLAAVTGTGDDGRITKPDVEAYLDSLGSGNGD
jgi:pyruvate/2-oxoglutarate dehydrogenase complex dihydrolipoamide acyltransferase (E2) component